VLSLLIKRATILSVNRLFGLINIITELLIDNYRHFLG